MHLHIVSNAPFLADLLNNNGLQKADCHVVEHHYVDDFGTLGDWLSDKTDHCIVIWQPAEDRVVMALDKQQDAIAASLEWATISTALAECCYSERNRLTLVKADDVTAAPEMLLALIANHLGDDGASYDAEWHVTAPNSPLSMLVAHSIVQRNPDAAALQQELTALSVVFSSGLELASAANTASLYQQLVAVAAAQPANKERLSELQNALDLANAERDQATAQATPSNGKLKPPRVNCCYCSCIRCRKSWSNTF